MDRTSNNSVSSLYEHYVIIRIQLSRSPTIDVSDTGLVFTWSAMAKGALTEMDQASPEALDSFAAPRYSQKVLERPLPYDFPALKPAI